jgi:hypothetical protein
VTSESPHDLTLLLHDWYRGDQAALDKIIPRVYAELRRLAHIYMVREQPGHILQTTALIHEAFLRLTQAENIEWQNRTHFLPSPPVSCAASWSNLPAPGIPGKEAQIRHKFHSMSRSLSHRKTIQT